MNRQKRSVLSEQVREAILGHMRGVKRTDLARQMNITPSHVTRLLQPGHAMTLRTLERVADALDLNLSVRLTGSAFTCPLCGSETWGTSNATGPRETWIGHCHGDCRYQWTRTTENDAAVGLRTPKIRRSYRIAAVTGAKP